MQNIPDNSACQTEDNNRHKRPKRILLLPLVCVIAAGATYSYSRYATPILRERRINRLTLQFEQQPSEMLGKELIAFLDNSTATGEQGSHILSTLLTPQIVTRTPYPTGIPQYVGLRFKTSLRSPGRLRYRAAVYHDGSKTG